MLGRVGFGADRASTSIAMRTPAAGDPGMRPAGDAPLAPPTLIGDMNRTPTQR